METKTWQEIAKAIETDSGINFIGRVISPLHVLGIEAYLLNLKERGITPKGYILVVAHETTGVGVSEELFHRELYEDVAPIILSDDNRQRISFSGLKKALSASDSADEFYIANPYRAEFSYISAIAMLRPNNRIIAVITDEGGASYLDNPYSFRSNWDPGWRFKDCLRFFLLSCIRDNLMAYFFIRKGIIRPFLMLEKQGKHWEDNKPCVEAILKVLKSRPPKEDYSEYENAVVICPSLIYEAGYMTGEEDIPIFKIIRDKMEETKFIIKPHPREKNVDRYKVLNCEIERRYTVTTEEILANLDSLPKCIIGESSTILFSAAALFGVKAISINKLIDRKYLADRRYFDSFNENFDGLVCIPKSEEELLKALEELRCLKE